jgi:hypothetical protein
MSAAKRNVGSAENPTATLKKWSIRGEGSQCYIGGRLYGDQLKRGNDGTWWTTTYIIRGPTNDGLIWTENSVYKLDGYPFSSRVVAKVEYEEDELDDGF